MTMENGTSVARLKRDIRKVSKEADMPMSTISKRLKFAPGRISCLLHAESTQMQPKVYKRIRGGINRLMESAGLVTQKPRKKAKAKKKTKRKKRRKSADPIDQLQREMKERFGIDLGQVPTAQIITPGATFTIDLVGQATQPAVVCVGDVRLTVEPVVPSE